LNDVILLCDCLNIFERAKIARWQHCNADNFRTLKANYMLIRLLCAHEMIKHVCKISRLISKRLLRKLQKNVSGYFILPHPVYLNQFGFLSAVRQFLLVEAENVT